MDGISGLPAELRARIWQYCLPDARHVIISRRRGRLQPPAIFHVCHESRSEAERFYTRAPATLEEMAIDRSASVWTAFAKDTICVEGDWHINPAQGRRPTKTLTSAQRLAFEFWPPQNFMQFLDILAPVYKCMNDMHDLREVILYSLPQKWFEDHTGRVQKRHPLLTNTHDAAKILLRFLHILFGGHEGLDAEAGIPPPLRWQFVWNEESDVWAGPFPDAETYEYVFRCASTGNFEIQTLGWEQLCRLKRVDSAERRVQDRLGAYEGCPEHASENLVNR